MHPSRRLGARALLAQAIRDQGDDETAALELRAARSTFEKLGAVPDRNAVDDLLAGLAASADLVSERGVKTFLFTDIVRSTDLLSAIGDEAWLDVVRWHDEKLRSLFVGRGGEEVDHAGDGFFVAFDDPASAIGCAVAIQRALADHRRAHGFAPAVSDRRPLDCGNQVGQIVPGQGCPRGRSDRLDGGGRRDRRQPRHHGLESIDPRL